ncbi:MAG: tetratricopeptide repeat protein [Oscillospiraceae bacterium]|nr:tetratricopeptide repeat protein [Oscillospiraceae bacterium]
MKKLLSLILAVLLTVTMFTSCADTAEALTSVYLNLGEKYLTDLDYEEAIVYFNKVIEVEPKNARAYLGSAEAYVAMGDIDSAIAILEQGIEAVDDSTELEAMLAELLGESEAEMEEEVPEDELEQEEEIPEITAEEIGAAINEASVFAWGWFWYNQHTDENDTIMGPDPYWNSSDNDYPYERVSEEGITTLDDVLALTKKYFTADIAESLVERKEWIEQDGTLYESATDGLGGFDELYYYEIYVEKVSDTLYDITLFEHGSDYSEDFVSHRQFTYSYVNGYWVFDTTLYWFEEVPIYVLTEPLDEETEETKSESDSSNIPFAVQAYTQECVNWSYWTSIGDYTVGALGDTLEISWDYDQYVFDGLYTSANTDNWTVNPLFAINIRDNGYLQLPENAEVGDTGDTGRYVFTYSDIVITATGYDDVVIPGDTIDTRFTIRQEAGYTWGTSVDIDLLSPILEQTGITLYQFANEYLPNMMNISFEITFVDWEP